MYTFLGAIAAANLVAALANAFGHYMPWHLSQLGSHIYGVAAVLTGLAVYAFIMHTTTGPLWLVALLFATSGLVVIGCYKWDEKRQRDQQAIDDAVARRIAAQRQEYADRNA